MVLPDLRFTCAVVSVISPPAPLPDVEVLSFPPFVIVNCGVVTWILPAFPSLLAVLRIPLSVSEMVTDPVAFTEALPAFPEPVLELVMVLPDVRVRVVNASSISPPVPAPDVEVLNAPWSAMVSVGVVTRMLPAFPMSSAVLRIPLSVPEMVTDPVAFAMTLPAFPEPVLELVTVLPEVRSTCADVSVISPPAPLPDVDVLSSPPSAIVRLGVITWILPAFPSPLAVLKRPLPEPKMETDSVAFAVTLPAFPEPMLELVMVLPVVMSRVVDARSISPPVPAPDVEVLNAPWSAIVSVGVVTRMLPAFPALLAVLKSPLLDPEMETDSLAFAVTLPAFP
jgi:hypothetical protein